MLDWLRYVPLALGDLSHNRKIIPKGPYVSKLWPQTWLFGDSVFRFKAPWSNSIYGSGAGETKADKKTHVGDIFDLDYRSYDSAFMPNDRWVSAFFYKRDWLFVGPWFIGEKACLTMRASIVKANELSSYQTVSFFHPRVFETVVADFLNSRFGHKTMGKKPRYCGPLNWSILDLGGAFKAVHFDIHDIQFSTENPPLDHLILFPIANDAFVEITFDFYGTRKEERKIDSRPVFQLANNIINSFSLKIGPKTQAKIDKVKKQCPDMSLTPNFPELKWPIKPDDVGKVEVVDGGNVKVDALPDKEQ